MKDCNDGGGGGKICDEAEGEGAVDVNDDGIVDIDGGAIHSSSNLQKFGSRFGRDEHKLDPYRVEHFHKGSIFRLNTTTNR